MTSVHEQKHEYMTLQELIKQVTGASIIKINAAINSLGINPYKQLRSLTQEKAEALGLTSAQSKKLINAIAIGEKIFTDYEDITSLCVSDPADAYSYLCKDLGFQPQERFVVVALDTNHKPLAKKIIEGSRTTVVLDMKDVFIPVILNPPSNCCIVAHNHPSGKVSPSDEDIITTKNLIMAGQALDIQVLDHLIIAGGRYHSIRSSNGKLWSSH